MNDLLANAYPWVKSLHVMAVIAWMAGLFYLPRLFVYHAEQVMADSETDGLFQTMESKLQRLIMTPSMVVAWACGLMLVVTPGIVDWGAVWPWLKAASIVAMTWFHEWLGQRRRDFALGRNRLDGRRYRIINEVPTILMVVIVLSVIVKF